MTAMSILSNVAKTIAPMVLSAVPGGAAINAGLSLLSSVTQAQNGAQPATTSATASGGQEVSSGFEF